MCMMCVCVWWVCRESGWEWTCWSSKRVYFKRKLNFVLNSKKKAQRERERESPNGTVVHIKRLYGKRQCCWCDFKIPTAEKETFGRNSYSRRSARVCMILSVCVRVCHTFDVSITLNKQAAATRTSYHSISDVNIIHLRFIVQCTRHQRQRQWWRRCHSACHSDIQSPLHYTRFSF